MVFYPDEIEALSVAFERGYKDNGNTACIGLMVNFDLGLRIGDADGKISLNQQKPSKHAGLR